jgi:UDP-N-acetylglucosamine 1-carboxyvinyltransferase
MGIKLRIEGGNKLNGTVKIDSAKNAVLPILAGVILTRGITVLKDVPRLIDIDNMLHILSTMGMRVRWQGSDLILDSTDMNSSDATASKAREIRGSIFILGGVLGRFKTARIAYPGGCSIGARPIDLHIQGLRDMGVSIREKGGFIECNSMRATGGTVYLDYPSVGATQNLIMAGTIGRNTVKIVNAAREPEIEDLVNYLNTCGARITGAGTSTIVIQGVKKLTGCTYTPIPDRIITGSYLLAVAAAGGDVTLTNTRPEHNESLIAKLKSAGCEIHSFGDKINIKATQRGKCITSIQTSPYPGFPTDLQSQISAYQVVSRGTSTVTENLFESRFKYVPELIKMGAQITVRDRTAIIRGVRNLSAVDVDATDLRGGVALVIAALTTDSVTVINNAEYIYRGHAAIEDDLSGLGANIIKIIE